MMVFDPATPWLSPLQRTWSRLFRAAMPRLREFSADQDYRLSSDHAEMIELSMLWHCRVHDDPVMC